MNETLLHEEINSSLKEMNEGIAGELGSEEYKEATNATTKLIDKVIDLKKLKIDEEQRKLDRESNERVALEKIRAEEREKKRILLELETELKIVKEKIEDAKGDNVKEQKYQLMRIQSNLEKEIMRIKHGMRYY